MLAIIDYGLGNLFSLSSSLKYIGVESVITSDPEVIRSADRIILPGVGAFRDAIGKLKETGLDVIVKEEASKGKPLMGICLGMQVLFDKSYEYGEYEGLGLLSGEVIDMRGTLPENLSIPQIGWNALSIKDKENPLLKYTEDGDFVYFVHSFYVKGDNPNTIASTDYGVNITASANKGNVYGCQFHPEKSGEVGLKILKAFSEI